MLIICDIIISDDGIFIVCKNFMHRHYRFKMDECLIFQKLSAQEMVILSALDHLTEEDKKESLKPKSKPISKPKSKIKEEGSESDSESELDSEEEESGEESD